MTHSFDRRRVSALLCLLAAAWFVLTPEAIDAEQTTPSRIVSTSPSITETLFALGLGDRVVGVSTFCRYPPEAAKLPKVGTFLKPDVELIAGLRPDLVVVHDVSSGIDRRLQGLGLRFVVTAGRNLPSAFATIRQIAGATGVRERGETLVSGIERDLAAIRSAAPERPKPRVLFIIGRRPGMLADLIAVGPGSYINELIEIAGGANVLAIAGQPEYPPISMETVLRLDPDVIVDTVDMGETDAERRLRGPVNEQLWARYPMLTATGTHRVHAATIDALVVPGPRVVDAARWVQAVIAGRRTP